MYVSIIVNVQPIVNIHNIAEWHTVSLLDITGHCQGKHAVAGQTSSVHELS